MDISNNIIILMRQTTYTEEECIKLLGSNTLEESIYIYLDVKKPDIKQLSTNQQIFKTIREFI